MFSLRNLLAVLLVTGLSSTQLSSASPNNHVIPSFESATAASTSFTHPLHPRYTIHGSPNQSHKQFRSILSSSFNSSSPSIQSDPTTDWDYNTSVRMDLYSIISYQNQTTVINWDCIDCNDEPTAGFTPTTILYDQETDSHGYIGYSTIHKEIVVVYRGTHSLQDWIDNIQFWKADTPFDGLAGAYTAQGFSYCHQKLKSQAIDGLRQTIEQVQLIDGGSDYKLFVTGHSLGGALATLAAMEFSYTYQYPLQVYTYGSPRSGDKVFAAYYDQYVGPTWRMTHDADPVPRLPFESMGFSHVKREIWQEDKDGIYHPCSSKSDDDPKCADSVFWFTNIYDHLHYMNLTCCSDTVPIDPTRLPVVIHDDVDVQSIYMGSGETESKLKPKVPTHSVIQM